MKLRQISIALILLIFSQLVLAGVLPKDRTDLLYHRYEGGGAAVLGSIQPQPVEFNRRGELDLDKVKQLVKPLDNHFAKTRLVCLENTQGGKVLALDYLEKAQQFTQSMGLKLHLDGARAFNAAVALEVPIKEISQHFDSISICLSKGLGAPVGSVLCASSQLIDKARRWRKVLGGGMRQSGILAAAGIYALQNNIDRLSTDHQHATMLAVGLGQIPGISLQSTNTNMVMFETDGKDYRALREFLAEREILISGGRLVTHLDITAAGIADVIKAFSEFAAQCQS